MNQLEQFREHCAKTIELCDDAMMAHDDYVLDPSECAGIVRAMPLPEVKFAPIGVDDLVAVRRSLLVAACSAISKKRDAPRTVANLRRHTTGDLSVSSSVESLRKENEQLRDALEKCSDLAVGGLCQMSHGGTRAFCEDIKLHVADILKGGAA